MTMSLNDQQEASTSFDFSNDTDDDWSPVSRIPVLDAVNTIIACLAVLGNGMVITVMLLRRRVFSSFTNRLILHQSVIDSITGVMFFFHHVVKSPNISVSIEGDIYDQFLCRFLYSDVLLWCMSVTSTYNIVIISLERFMATCYPVKHRNTWSTAKLKFAAVTAWAIGFVYGSHFSLIVEPHQGHCRMIEIGLGVKPLYHAWVTGIEYIVPITIMTFTYTRILIMLTKKVANPVNGHQNTMSKAKKNVLITTLLIGIMFVVCWTPIEVLYLASNDFWNSGPMYTVSTSLLTCNMLINPIIYCFKYEQFRAQLKNLLVFKRYRRNKVNVEPIAMNHQ